MVLVILFSFAACGKTDTGATTTQTITTAQTTLQQTNTTAAKTTMDIKTTAEPTPTQNQTDARTEADTKATANTTAPAVKTFNATQLAEFNGKNGNAAYVAYNKIVYNVTSTTWENGEHKGLLAGTDITDDINSCKYHSAVDFFQKVWERKNYPQVGTYIG